MNTFGRIFRVSIFGESHGDRLGAVVDGVKPGIPLSVNDFLPDIDRRRAGAAGTTPRTEADEPEIVSGVYEGHTTGAPLTVLFRSSNTRPADYDILRDIPRPGHADMTGALKFCGQNDPRGGGHFSGRLTLPVVAAGVIAKKMLPGVTFNARIVTLGGIPETDSAKWDEAVAGAAREGDSLGATAECNVEGVPAGLGEPFWDSVESCISHAVFAIPGVRGVEFGDGFAAAAMKGSCHNDRIGPDGPLTNHAGGVNGGISNGASIVFRVAFKPTSSIAKPQKTWNFREGREVELNVPGRHDTCFALRTPPVVESVAAIALCDLALRRV